ncbi:MAG: NADH-quinone oxidoreductase subunit A [Verrucomicrobia bacterium]|nr:NADH-quinone oxidoreductase subunit A [Verrucomicrobiota bacterium]
MVSDFLPILLQAIVAIGFAVVVLVASVAFGKAGRTTKVKDSAYECGMLPIGESSPRFSVKFYLVAMLFVLFDLEVVFLYPWAVVYQEFLTKHGLMILWSMLGFVGILTVAYAYALKKGALDWK